MTTTSTLIQNVSPEELTVTLRAIIREELNQKDTAPRYLQKDPLFSIEEFIDYLPGKKLARQTIYGLVNLRKVPFEKHGSRLYFRKSAIDQWLSNGRQITKA